MVGQRTASACSFSSVNEHLSSPWDSEESGRIKGSVGVGTVGKATQSM